MPVFPLFLGQSSPSVPIDNYLDSYAITTGFPAETQSRSGYGHQPKGLIGFGGGSSSSVDSAGLRSILFSFGLASGATARGSVCGGISLSGANTLAKQHYRSDAFIALQSSNLLVSNTDGRFDISSFNSDGLTLIIDEDNGCEVWGVVTSVIHQF